MSTAIEIIKGSLKKLGVIAQGETPGAEESADALRALNSMLDSWSTQGLLVLGTAIEEFTLTSGQGSYTLGTGGDLATTVPVRIDSAFIKLTGNTEQKLKLIDNQKYGEIEVKNVSGIPYRLFIDRNYPLMKLYLDPVPDAAHTLKLHTYRQFTTISSLSTSFSLPRGYERAIEYNLCIELADDYGANVSPNIYKIASEALSNIKRLNSKAVEIPVDNFLIGPGRYDIGRGE